MPKLKTNTAPEASPRSSALAVVLEAAEDMADTGLIDKKTLRDYESLCLEVPPLSSEDVVRIRTRSNTSQSYFARVLNVSASTVRQWESGAKRPSGLAAKILTLVDRKGLQFLIEDSPRQPRVNGTR